MRIFFPVGSQEESIELVTYVPIPEYVLQDERLMEDREAMREQYQKEQRKAQKRGLEDRR